MLRHSRFIGTAVLVVQLAAAVGARAQSQPRMPEVDRVRLAEAFRLCTEIGNDLWPGLGRQPFPLLLVTPKHEFLIRHPFPTPDFQPLGYDSLLKSRVFVRPRQFPTHFLATFPAVNRVSTIVVGEAESTLAKKSSPWVAALMHEHFHQLQYSRPGYDAGVAALGLSRGDSTGMWMLNYAFPYDSVAVERAFGAMMRALSAALQAAGSSASPVAVQEYRAAKERFRATLAADEYRYAAFQQWQEGVARYTELKAAEVAAAKFTPSPAFRALSDYTPFGDAARDTRANILDEIPRLSLKGAKRVVFYYWGAGEALLLDATHPGWQAKYFTERYSMDSYLAP